ncbi:MAG: family 43 glycosylhydrolase [Bacteroidaceae bacterium]|nr:family 43 glycosylhydrolase [Bacteroidaceae bacterium]
MKQTCFAIFSMLVTMTVSAQYTLKDWNIEGVNENGVLHLNVSEYKLNYNHPLPYADWQKGWTVKAELRCGTLGTEQVFVCKEGKANHLIGRNSLNGDISIGYDNMHGQFFVEVIDNNEEPHRLCAGPTVETGRWYSVEARAEYDARKDVSTVRLEVDGQSAQLIYPGKALRHNCSLWVIGHGFPGGFPNALQVRNGDLRNLYISGEPLPRVDGQNPLFTGIFTADPAFTVVGNTVYAYVGEDKAGVGGWFHMPHWLCFSSTDMIHWKAHGSVLAAADFPYAQPGGSWAGQVVKGADGKFYYYVTLDRKDNRLHTIDVAVSDSPTGPFRPARKDGTPLITDDMTPDSHRANADIDPTVLIDDDGTPWMAWGNGDCYMVKLKKNMTELDGEVRKVPMRNYSEGPWLFKRGKLYYNVYASDAPGVQPEQMAYSYAESILGPWTYGGFVSTSANHGFTIHPSVIEFKGKWYYVYHDGSYSQNGQPGGDCRRSVCAEHLYFDKSGTIKFIPLTQEGISRKVKE